MITYILVLVLTNSYKGGISVTQIEFKDKAYCEKAAKEIDNRSDVDAFCVERR